MNKRMLNKSVCVLMFITLSISLIACSKKEGKQASSEKKVVEIACMSTFEPIIEWIGEGLAPHGYDVKVVMFDANQLPATALKDGDVDGLIHNQLGWIKTFNKENNCDLQMPEPYLAYARMAIYSSKYKTIEEIPQDAQIAVPGDPSNMERSLMILKDVGIITLGEKTEKFYTVLDIKDNPKNIKILETEISTTARSINDVDAIICPAQRVKVADIDPNSFLYEDPLSKNHPQSLVVNLKDVDAHWVKEVLKLFQTEDFKRKFNEYYNGTYVLYDN